MSRYIKFEVKMKYNQQKIRRDELLKKHFESIVGFKYTKRSWNNIKSLIYRDTKFYDIMQPGFKAEVENVANIKRVKKALSINTNMDSSCLTQVELLLMQVKECDRQTFYNALVEILEIPTTRRLKYYLFRKVGWLGGVEQMSRNEQFTVAIDALKWLSNKNNGVKNVKDYSTKERKRLC